MQNLKIKVNNETESKEVQELLFELGFEWKYRNIGKNYYKDNSAGFLYADSGCITTGEKVTGEDYFENHTKLHKEITIAELRSMVKPMQEYLIPSRNYEYILTDAREALEPHAKDWIEIPEGANYAYKDESSIHFTKLEMGYRDLALIWLRLQQPEALPFIDDEPQSLNDQYAEIKQVRQAIKVKSGSDSDHAVDAMAYGFIGAGAAQASGGVDATLKERQSTYGNFEDVAFVTENIMAVLSSVRTNGLSDLPHTHRMALYMIASKMARIVNGDFNHLDSWHDIGGYSKLIEKLINGE